MSGVVALPPVAGPKYGAMDDTEELVLSTIGGMKTSYCTRKAVAACCLALFGSALMITPPSLELRDSWSRYGLEIPGAVCVAAAIALALKEIGEHHPRLVHVANSVLGVTLLAIGATTSYNRNLARVDYYDGLAIIIAIAGCALLGSGLDRAFLRL